MNPTLDFMNLSDLANYLGLSIGTVRHYRCKKPSKLPPAYNLTGRPLWRKSEVDMWIRARKEVSHE